MINLIQCVLAIVIVFEVILSMVIFSRGIKSSANIIFGLFTFSSVIWSIAIIAFYTEGFRQIINWVVLTHSSALLISFLFLIFTTQFPKKLIISKTPIIVSFIPFVIIIFYILFTNLIIGETNGYTYEIHRGYIAYALLMIFYFSAGFIFLLLQYKRARSQLEKKQVAFIITGPIIAASLAIIPDLIFPYFGIFDYTWLGPMFSLIMVVSLFIAMSKYHLFNIKVILTEIISVVIVVTLLIELFFVQSNIELILKAIVLILVAFFSFLLIKGVNNEISQREQIQSLATDLEKTNSRLVELDRQKSEFVSFATHQLRGPLTAMKGYASLLLEGDMGELPKAARQGVERIYDSTNTLVAIVNDYLNISRIELGAMKYAFQTVDLRSLVEDVVAELKPNIDKAGVKFTFTAQGNVADYRVTADRDKLKQVFANVIDNSLKYTPKGSIDATLTRDRTKNLFVFKIKDTGVGIAPETLPHLFQKFSRAENASKTNIRGTGLGLYVAKQMISAHHGTIRAESEGEGKGSTFIVELEPFEKG